MVIHNKVIGQGCPYCSGKKVLKGFSDLATLSPELIEEWDYDKNAPLAPDEVTKGSNKKVWWKCKKGHKWEAAIVKRTAGRGCPICSRQKVLIGYNDLVTLKPDIAKQWHPTKNGTITPQMMSPFSHKKVWWICDKGHEWETEIANRSSGEGCPFCSGHSVLAGYNDLATLKPELSKQWHPNKNEGLQPDMVSIGSSKKVWWKCNEGHEWQARVSNRANGTDCPICRKKKKK